MEISSMETTSRRIAGRAREYVVMVMVLFSLIILSLVCREE